MSFHLYKYINMNVVYAIISTLLVTLIIFLISNNIDLFYEDSEVNSDIAEGFEEGLNRKNKKNKKSSKVSSRGKKREEKTVKISSDDDFIGDETKPQNALGKMSDKDMKNYVENEDNKNVDINNMSEDE